MQVYDKILVSNLYDVVRVGQLPDDLTLIQDSQDCLALMDSLGRSRYQYEGDSYFVRIGEGEYIEVWQVIGFVPRLDSLAKRIA